MADWPLIGGVVHAAAGVVAGSTDGTTVTSSATADTKGAWAELSASLPFDVQKITLHFTQTTVNVNTFLLDLGIGTAGSEQVIVPDLISGHGTSGAIYQVDLPVAIPVGTRLAARVASSATSATMIVAVHLEGKQDWIAPPPFSTVSAYGANTADSGGTSVDPGGTVNTKGAWVELTSSVAGLTRGLLIGMAHQNNNTGAVAKWLVDVGIGAAGAEQIIISDLWVRGTGTRLFTPNYMGPYPVNIPAGTRLAVRTQCTITDASDRLIDFAAYGLE
jgi:hypothetical protein